MSLHELMLLIISYLKENNLTPGRTLLQKYGYFALIKLDHRMIHNAHYFGPYSSELGQCVQNLKIVGLLQESFELLPSIILDEFGGLRYSYSLTEKGKNAVEAIKQKYQEDSKKVLEVVSSLLLAGGRDTRVISNAAKIHYILVMGKHQNIPNGSDLKEYAQNYGWNIHQRSIDRSIRFLRESEFISN